MRRILGPLLLAAFGVWASLGLAAEIMTNDSVAAMVKAGLGEELVIAKIRQSPEARYELSTNDLIAL